MSQLQQREASASDLVTIVALTRAQRRSLAEWSPVFFNPREGADDGHAGFLAFLVSSDDHETFVVESEGMVVGFFVRIHQPNHVWIDDLCVDDPARWFQVIRALRPGDADWVTCVAAKDLDRLSALTRAGANCLSRYWVRSTSGVAAVPSADPAAVDADPRFAAPHTWTIAADLLGSLVVTDGQGGYVIGSPSMSPPIYDPGGPTCVIDQVVGEDREGLVAQALAACAGRGDAQVVVVCREVDSSLVEILELQGFPAEVLLMGAQLDSTDSTEGPAPPNSGLS